MKTVILAEKPDQARKYASALGITKNGQGFIEVTTDILKGDVIVTWGVGHLVGLSSMEAYGEQYKKWNKEQLPFKPNEMKYEVLDSSKKQFYCVQQQLKTADRIIVATDPDREGELIAYSIFNMCGSKVKDIPKQRLWINCMVTKEIRKGFSNLREGSETYNYYKEAETRQIADYLVGMNFTRYISVDAQSKGIKSEGAFTAGRVQTPTFMLVIKNDFDIKNFKPEKFFKIYGFVDIDKEQVVFRNDTKYGLETEAKNVLKNLKLDKPLDAQISSVIKEKKIKKAPKLFNLGGIQSYANKKWKYSLDKTLKVVQGLYQEGFLSYPRTDCNLITVNEFEYLKNYLEEYKSTVNVSFVNSNLEARKEYVNDNKVLEHYALIPTENIPNLNGLSEEEKNIYSAVVKNSILMFTKDYEYESTTVTIQIEDMNFIARGKVPITLGWSEVEQLASIDEGKEEKECVLPDFKEGESVIFNGNIEESITTAPTRLTEAKLGGDNGLMNKLGLGTQATRSNIISGLIQRNYLKVEKTKLYPTEKATLIYEYTKDVLLGKPEMTAEWEKYLKTIGKGEGKQSIFIDNINRFIENVITKLKNNEISESSINRVIDSNIISW